MQVRAQGWVDAGYRDVPTALEVGRGELATAEHRSGRVHVVPGLRVPSTGGPGDVVRGEETQVVGILEAVGLMATALAGIDNVLNSPLRPGRRSPHRRCSVRCCHQLSPRWLPR